MKTANPQPSTLNHLAAHLRDPVWRLRNLYWVKTADGRAVPFRPNAAQEQIIDAVHVLKQRKLLIPKARQLGMSTVIALIILDLMLFGAGVQAAIVDQTQVDATKKLRGKVLFAFQRLPAVLRDRYQVLKANDHVLSIRLRGKADDTASEVQAGMNARGDTFQVLHISEWGPIAFRDPRRSEEIMTGARPAAKVGLEFIETTWKGGKCGHLWELTKAALEIPEAHRTVQDFAVHFFPWWGDADYALEGDARQIPRECRKYLDEAEAEIRAKGADGRGSSAQCTVRSGQSERFAFTPAQRLWYFKVAWGMGLLRFQEYPSMLSECFRAPIEGAIYAELLDKLRAAGRLAAWDADPALPVNTCWDLGAPQNMVTWHFQLRGDQVDVIDCDCGLDLTPGERVELLRTKSMPDGRPYRYGYHFLPHDAAASKEGGRTIQAELEAAGLVNTRVVPRTDDVWIGINRVRLLLPRMRFRTPQCDKALNSLEAYRSGIWIDKGRQMDVPVHDRASHAADALRVVAEAELAGMLEAGWAQGPFSAKGLEALRGA